MNKEAKMGPEELLYLFSFRFQFGLEKNLLNINKIFGIFWSTKFGTNFISVWNASFHFFSTVCLQMSPQSTCVGGRKSSLVAFIHLS